MSRPVKNTLEWLVFGVSACIVLAAVGLLVWSVLVRDDRPPDVRVFTGRPSRIGRTWRVPVGVRNFGDTTAEQVQVEVVLERDGKEVESATVTFAFVPRRSLREGWVNFHEDPRCCTLKARAAGLAEP